MSKDLVQPQPSPDQPQCDHPVAWRQRAEALEIEAVELRQALPDDLRKAGWSVAVHNDYRLGGEQHTFWLFTHPDGRWIKGEGLTDAEALAAARAALAPAEEKGA